MPEARDPHPLHSALMSSLEAAYQAAATLAVTAPTREEREAAARRRDACELAFWCVRDDALAEGFSR